MTPYPYQTKNGIRYRVIYRTPDFKQHQKRGFRTKTSARAWYRRKMVELENHGFTSNDRVTVGDVAKRWLENKKETVAGSTYRKYETEYRQHIIPTLGQKYISRVSLAECQQATDQWAKELKFCNKLVNDVVSIFDLAIKYKLIHDNPFREVVRPKIKNKAKIRSFTRAEFETFQKGLAAHYGKTNQKAFTFLYILSHTGLRKGELSALRWQDIDFDKGLLHIKRAVTRDSNNHLIIGRTKNIYSVRNVPIGQHSIAILQKWRLEQRKELTYFNVNSIRPGQLVFTNRNGGILSPSKPGKWLKVIEQKYGLPTYVTPHGLRHTYTVLLIDNGVPVNKVASILGHKDASITIGVYNDLHPVVDNSVGNVIENL